MVDPAAGRAMFTNSSACCSGRGGMPGMPGEKTGAPGGGGIIAGEHKPGEQIPEVAARSAARGGNSGNRSDGNVVGSRAFRAPGKGPGATVAPSTPDGWPMASCRRLGRVEAADRPGRGAGIQLGRGRIGTRQDPGKF